MIKLYQPTKGQVLYDGKDIFKQSHAEKREFCNKVQMIFQNPYSSLNPRMTVKEIVGEGLKQQGISQKEIDERVDKPVSYTHLAKMKPDSYTASCAVNEADRWREGNVWYPGRSVRNAPRGVTVIVR